jgi:hypothetical protein
MRVMSVMVVTVRVAMVVVRTRLRRHGEHRQHGGDGDQPGE